MKVSEALQSIIDQLELNGYVKVDKYLDEEIVRMYLNDTYFVTISNFELDEAHKQNLIKFILLAGLELKLPKQSNPIHKDAERLREVDPMSSLVLARDIIMDLRESELILPAFKRYIEKKGLADEYNDVFNLITETIDKADELHHTLFDIRRELRTILPRTAIKDLHDYLMVNL